MAQPANPEVLLEALKETLEVSSVVSDPEPPAMVAN